MIEMDNRFSRSNFTVKTGLRVGEPLVILLQT